MGVLPNEYISKDTFHAPDLVVIRCNNIDAFETFCTLCLRHVIGSCSWKKEHRKTKVSKIFTLCDESFAFLVLEIKWLYWKAFYDRGRDDEKLVAETKFMVHGSMGGLKGWHNDGIKLFGRRLQHQWNVDHKNVLKSARRIFDDDDSELEEDVEPWIIDF